MATLVIQANQIKYTITVIEEEELAYISEAVQHNDNYDGPVYGFIYRKKFYDPTIRPSIIYEWTSRIQHLRTYHYPGDCRRKIHLPIHK
jgi:hypothetical protein